MELHQIRYFLALARSLNFTRAAEQCNVTQPALTKAIQKLELELGGALIHRERQLTQLTDLGKLVLPMLERAFVAAESVRTSAVEFQRREIAPLKIALATCVSPAVIERPLMEIAKFMPGLKVELLEARPGQINELLLTGTVNVAISGDDGSEAALRIDHWPLFEERMLVLTPHQSRLAGQEEVSIEDLATATWLERSGYEGTSASLGKLLPPGVEVKVGHRGASLAYLQYMVSAGLGLMLWPEHSPHLDSVTTRMIEGDPLRRSVDLRVVQGRRYSPALEAMVKIARIHDWRQAFPKPDRIMPVKLNEPQRAPAGLEARLACA
jgi:DNA-binding transcriptional LysR family regulator